ASEVHIENFPSHCPVRREHVFKAKPSGPPNSRFILRYENGASIVQTHFLCAVPGLGDCQSTGDVNHRSTDREAAATAESRQPGNVVVGCASAVKIRSRSPNTPVGGDV